MVECDSCHVAGALSFVATVVELGDQPGARAWGGEENERPMPGGEPEQPLPQGGESERPWPRGEAGRPLSRGLNGGRYPVMSTVPASGAITLILRGAFRGGFLVLASSDLSYDPEVGDCGGAAKNQPEGHVDAWRGSDQWGNSGQ